MAKQQLTDVVSGLAAARTLCDAVVNKLEDVIHLQTALEVDTTVANSQLADAIEERTKLEEILNDLTAAQVVVTAVSAEDIKQVRSFLVRVQEFALAEAAAKSGMKVLASALDAASDLASKATGGTAATPAPPPTPAAAPTTTQAPKSGSGNK